MPRRIALALCAVMLCAPAQAGYVLMFERDADAGGGNELAFRTYATFSDLLTNTILGPDVFSPIDISPAFSTTGLTFDGSQYILTFERDADAGGGNELAFRTYATFSDLLTNTIVGPDVFSPIDISPAFSTTGLTFDGSQYILTFERDADAGGGNELAFRTYATFNDLLTNTPSGPDVISPIDISPAFSTTGLTFDGSQYILTFERDADAGGGNELAFRTYATFSDLLTNTIFGPDVFSPIDISSAFSTTGLTFDGSFNGGHNGNGGSTAVPEPGGLALLGLSLAGMLAARRRHRIRD